VGLFSSAARLIDGPVERGQCNFCLFLSKDDNECKGVLLSVLPPIFGIVGCFMANYKCVIFLLKVRLDRLLG